jgi:hypothetical protein
MHPENADIPFPMVLTGPRESAAYFEQIDAFLRLALGDAAARRYQIIVDSPQAVARAVTRGMQQVREARIGAQDAFFFNWGLRIDYPYQVPFAPTHANMAGLELRRDRPPHELAADLRRAFSGIVAGNVKEDGIRAIERHGPFEIDGDAEIMRALDRLLAAFVAQNRMKLPGAVAYQPCYRVVTR